MAKRANKVEEIMEEPVVYDETTAPSGVTVSVEAAPVVEVDANGRKKKVDLTMEQLEELGLKNKSQVIRYLDANGYSRSAIALFLNIRYQFVRNVLVTPLKKG